MLRNRIGVADHRDHVFDFPTCLHDVELLRDEGVEAMTEGEEEVHGLDRDGAEEPLGPLHTSSAHLVRSDLR